MPVVPILFFEDAPLVDPEALDELLAFPKSAKAGGVDYEFIWHPRFNALGSDGELTLIRSLEAYRNAANFLRNELVGEAIIITDLYMQPHGSTERFKLTDEDITDSVFKTASCLDDRVKRKSDVLENFNPDRVGLLLALNAVSNPNWSGIIAFASGMKDVDLSKLKDCSNSEDRIVWKDLKLSFSVPKAATVLKKAAAINSLIDLFLETRSGPPFWPAGTECWFDSIDSVPPHNTPEPLPEVVGMIKEYLGQLLTGFVPPESWFLDMQWKGLYATLKGLMGAHSASVSTQDNPKNLPLTAVPLLLAAQMAWKGNDIEWLKTFEWNLKGVVEIMEHKNPVDAREAIRTMAVFLEHLSAGNNGTQVIGASWGKVPGDQAKHLWIDFRIDPLNRVSGRGLLETIYGSRWGNGEGQTVSAYVKMMEKARAGSKPPAFSLCIYPIYQNDEGPYTRLDFRSLKG